ncbi:MAG: DUF4446 family protein [Actinobacteria bacterium]|nr:DUF4446 family protein [Actinomycetota bacterium]
MVSFWGKEDGSLDTLRDNAGVLIALLFLGELALFAAIFVLFRQLSLLRRNITILKRGAEGSSLVEKVASQALQIEDIYHRLDEQAAQKEYLTEVLAGALQRVAVVRFDAFEDMGGKLSYSAAMLDENGDGVIFTSIYGRNENRTYAKAVLGGRSSHVLSREEAEALKRALSAKPPLIRARKAREQRLFDLQTVEEAGGESRREDDGSWVM